ncbi:flavodoxin family protein [Bacillus sp. BGMRC 2118]|nr:flavodoxin family protein [Bacillus sp. BGMRC 2118]
MFVIYGSSRKDGNSEQLADVIISDLNVEKVYLTEKKILPIIDKRHDIEGFHSLKDDYYEVVYQMLPHKKILFVTPLYWYGMSGLMKNFIDRWSESLRDTSMEFKQEMKDKKMYVLITGGDEPKQKALPLVMQFQYIFDYFGASFEGYVIGEGNKPNDIVEDKLALQQAGFFKELLSEVN